MADPATLVPNPRNPNTHPESQIKLLAKIIEHQGWRSPIVVSKRSGFVVVGHGRLQAAQLLKCTEVPVDEQDFASEADEWAHMVADNRLAELAEMDSAILSALLKDVGDTIDLTGFDAESQGLFDAQEVEVPELADGDRAPFRQMTFTVHDEQFTDVEAALAKAKAVGGGKSAVNENSNGNALAWVCRAFNRQSNG